MPLTDRAHLHRMPLVAPTHTWLQQHDPTKQQGWCAGLVWSCELPACCASMAEHSAINLSADPMYLAEKVLIHFVLLSCCVCSTCAVGWPHCSTRASCGS
jgi:hypothetical protein